MKENAIKISHILADLIRWAEIEFVEYTGDQVKELVGYSPGRRTRFYFIKKEIIDLKINEIKNKPKKEKGGKLLYEHPDYWTELRNVYDDRGLCTVCGGERESYKFKLCNKCREYYRDRYRKNKKS